MAENYKFWRVFPIFVEFENKGNRRHSLITRIKSETKFLHFGEKVIEIHECVFLVIPVDSADNLLNSRAKNTPRMVGYINRPDFYGYYFFTRWID
jgi:hypothetical protein